MFAVFTSLIVHWHLLHVGILHLLSIPHHSILVQNEVELSHNISWLLAVNVLERRAQAITKDAAQLLIFFPGLSGNFHHPLEVEIVVLRLVVQMVCAFGYCLQLLLEALV